MIARVDAFADLNDVPVFEPKPKPEIPIAKDAADRIADENNFQSRQPPKAQREPRRKRRVYTTGRNVQLNIKAKGDTIARFHKLADERSVPLGELFELAVDALEKQGAAP